MLSLQTIRHLTFGLVVATPLLAQDPTARATSQSQLVVKTTDRRIAGRLARDAEPAALKDGEHYVLTMGDGGDWSCVTATGKVAFLVIDLRPALLMDTFADQVEQAQNMASMAATVGAANSPMKPKDMARMVQAMFDFPRQIDAMSLVIERDQKRDQNGGYVARAELVPVAKSGFAGTLNVLKASGKGVPQVGDGDGAMAMAFDVDLASAKAVLEPLIDWATSITGQGEDAATRQIFTQTWNLMDGTGSFAMAAGKMRMLFGTTDASKLRQLVQSDDWLALQRGMLAKQPNMEMKVTREKLGDLDVLKTEGNVGDASPLFKDGKMSGYSAVVGDLMIADFNAGQQSFLDLVAAVNGAKVKRAPLPGGALMTMQMRLADLLAMNEEMDIDTSRMPKVIDIAMGKKDQSALKIDVRVQM